jgi:hypothetical protein
MLIWSRKTNKNTIRLNCMKIKLENGRLIIVLKFGLRWLKSLIGGLIILSLEYLLVYFS